MKFAAITDPTGFRLVEQFRLGYHLVLAQYVLSDSRYAHFYRKLHEAGHFIMLDNGCAEGITLSPQKLIEAANAVGADEIAMQDVWEDSDKTLEVFRSLEPWVPAKHRMIIPQGRTKEEWMACLKEMLRVSACRTIGVPKHLEGKGGRANILEEFAHHVPWTMREHEVHLLGVWDNPIVEVKDLVKRLPWVRGIDSAAPFAWAQQHLVIDTTTPHIGHVWGSPFSSGYATMNMQIMLETCEGI